MRWRVLGLAGLALGASFAILSTLGPRADLPADAPEAGTLREPNVLVIVWDTVRADHLSLYGYARPTTPRLQAWAEHAVVYDRAISPGIWTLSAHASMFTGLPPESTGANERWIWLDSHHVTFAEHFRSQGYQTFSFAANTLLHGETNLVQGFDVALNTFSGKARGPARNATRDKLIPGDRSNELCPEWRPPEHGAHNAEWARAIYKDAAPLIGRAFVKWLDERADPDRPFLAYLNFMEAHTPRVPSLASRKALLDDDLIRLGLETDQGHINLHFYNFKKLEYTERELDAIRGVYDAALLDLDAATGALIDALAERGVLDDTVVVLTSDHGENLGDHHLFNHRFALYDTLIHVPLVVRYPRALSPGRVRTPVTTRDLFGTLIDLTGVARPADARAWGHLQAAPSPAVATMELPLEREVETVRLVHPDVLLEPWMRQGWAVVGERYKRIRWSDDRHELYDASRDPGELNNLHGQLPEVEATLDASLDTWLEARPDYDPSLRGPEDDPKTVRASQADLRRQLEALGYVQD